MVMTSGANCNYIDGLPLVSDSAEEGHLSKSTLTKQDAYQGHRPRHYTGNLRH